MKIFIIALMLLLPSFSYAQEEVKEDFNTEEEIIENDNNCSVIEDEIGEDIKRLGSCWQDSDCVEESFGCPWEPYVCHRSVTSTSEEGKTEAVEEKISRYWENCHEKEAQCEEFSNVDEAECGEPKKLVCLNGRCVNQTKIIIQGDGNGKDIFGSREVIE